MTVKPEDCIQPTASEQKFIQEFEVTIDKELRERFTTISSKVQVSTPTRLNDRVFNIIKAMYSKHGWQVVQASSGGSDPRGTDPARNYLEFSKASVNHNSSNGYFDR